MERFNEVIDRADELGHPDVRMLPRLPFAIVLQLSGDADGLTKVLADVRAIAGSDDAVPAWADALAGWLDGPSGIDRIVRAVDRLTADGHLQTSPYLLALLAERQLDAGHVKEAQRTLDKAIELSDRTEERFFASELYRLLGRAHASAGDIERASSAYDRASQIAEAQRAAKLVARVDSDRLQVRERVL
jgi:tetratricopeptide (TPR) repeat protein